MVGEPSLRTEQGDSFAEKAAWEVREQQKEARLLADGKPFSGTVDSGQVE